MIGHTNRALNWHRGVALTLQRRKRMPEFTSAVKDVEGKCAVLLSSPKYRMESLPRKMPSAGVYAFSEKGEILFVGRSNNMRTRLLYHTRDNHNQATLAFLLARLETGNTRAAYKQKGSRADLLNQPDFRSAFDRARQRMRGMEVQFVEEPDPIRQALLQICTSLRGKSKHNDFDNH